MNATLFERLKKNLRKLWEMWSTIQDSEDEVWQEETGRESFGHRCDGASTQGKKMPTNDVPDLSDLVEQRNAETNRSRPDKKD
jgi:hypothetical protein